jgi:hypothetical protein
VSADVCEGLDAVPGQAGQQMRSGIIAPTVPASRVHTICKRNEPSSGVGSRQGRSCAASCFPGEPTSGVDRLHHADAAAGRAELAEPLSIARGQIGDSSAGGIHELPGRPDVSEPHEVADLVEDHRTLLSW